MCSVRQDGGELTNTGEPQGVVCEACFQTLPSSGVPFKANPVIEFNAVCRTCGGIGLSAGTSFRKPIMLGAAGVHVLGCILCRSPCWEWVRRAVQWSLAIGCTERLKMQSIRH